MTLLLNQYSYPFIVLGILAAIGLLLGLSGVRIRRILLTQVVLIGVFVAGYFALRTGEGDLTDITGFDVVLTNDRPTFIEFFSNFCTGCLVMRPTVDALITDIGADFNVLRVNIHTDAGRELSQRLGFSFTPEFVLLDADGLEVWRDHIPPNRDILSRAQ